MIIYTRNISPRLSYITEFIFREVYGLEPELTDNPGHALSMGKTFINYSTKTLEGAIQIRPSGLLESNQIDLKINPLWAKVNGFPVLFPDEKSVTGFDVFSASFYMLSRYEEYLPAERDHHGRFTSDRSIASRAGFIKLPVVNIWVSLLKDAILKANPDPGFISHESKVLYSFDIDNPWAHRNKSVFRLVPGLFFNLLKGNLSLFRERWRVYLNRQEDPFDSYDFILKKHRYPRIFILVGNRGKHDSRFNTSNPNWRALVKKLSENSLTGIHPSYSSNQSDDYLKKEIKILKEVTGKKPWISRQHFLIIDFPFTYRHLLRHGIREDYSMGYADSTGFRAGTSSSFLFYDLLAEKKTGLRIYPFCVMDRTLKDYMKLKPSDAVKEIEFLVDTVSKWGGNFIPVWHNESLGTSAEWKEWKEVYLKLTEIAGKKLKPDDTIPEKR